MATRPAELLMRAAPADSVVTTSHGSHRGHVHSRHIKETFDEDHRRPWGFSVEIYTLFDWRKLQFFESYTAVKSYSFCYLFQNQNINPTFTHGDGRNHPDHQRGSLRVQRPYTPEISPGQACFVRRRGNFRERSIGQKSS